MVVFDLILLDSDVYVYFGVYTYNPILLSMRYEKPLGEFLLKNVFTCT